MNQALPPLPCHWQAAELADGRLALVVVARQTFVLEPGNPDLQPLAPADAPGVLLEPRRDEGEPPDAPATLEADTVPEKPLVDVFVLGEAIAPGEKPLGQWPVEVRIGRRSARLLVSGPRAVLPKPARKDGKKLVPQLPGFGPPQPISRLPLSLRHAYGGTSWLVVSPEDRALAEQVAAQLVVDELVAAPSPEVAPPAASPAAAEEAAPPHGATRSATRAAAKAAASPFGRREVAGDDLALVDEEPWQAEAAVAAVAAEPAAGPAAEQRLIADAALLEGGAEADWAASLRDSVAAEHAANRARDAADAKARQAAAEAALADAPRLACPTNPYGKGFCLSLDARVLALLELPQLEAPDQLLTPESLVQNPAELDALPPPATTTALPASCSQRAALFGVLPSARPSVEASLAGYAAGLDLTDPAQVQTLAALQKQGPPAPLQAGFWNSAPLSMQWPALLGGEDVELTGVDAAGPLRFFLPRQQPAAHVQWHNKTLVYPQRLDTVIFEPQARRVSLVWRAAVPLASWASLAEGELTSVEVLVGERAVEQAGGLSDGDVAETDGEGTRIEREPWSAPVEEPSAQPRSTSRTADAAPERDALLLEREGQYVRTDGADWSAELVLAHPTAKAADGAARADEERAALAALADAEAKVADRRRVIATALAAGKAIPPLTAAKP